MKLTYIQQSGSPPVGDGGDQYTGWDRFGRVVDQRWLKVSSGADLERVQYGFDRGSNRLWRKNVVAGTGQDEVYGYDGLNQVESLQRGTLNATKTGISGTPAWEEDFSFDPTGNWNNYVNQVSGTTTLNQPRTHNAANEILTISGSSALMVQDGAGNLIKAPKVSDWTSANVMIYDGWNRLVKVLDGGTVVGEYGYDGQNRRVTKATGTTTRHYYYSSPWQIVEERLGSVTTAERQFVWGLMDLDNLVLRDRGSERLYGLQDVFNSTAVVDAGGAVQERYGYNAFGLSRVMDASFNPRSVSSFDWETRYACYRFDSESNFYQVRNRYLHPNLGRWLSRDFTEYQDGNNLYAYVGNNSMSRSDPAGLWATKDHTSLTKSGFDYSIDQLQSQPSNKCKKFMLDTINAGNVSQDHVHFNDLRRHYNRPVVLIKSHDKPMDWDARYQSYLQEESAKFNSYLNNPSKKTCEKALKSFGRTTHSWQDFFAHARIANLVFHRKTPCTIWLAWTNGITGDPNNRSNFWPSSYSLTLSGEHPRFSEPINRNGAEGVARYNAADTFDKAQMPGPIQTWFQKCCKFCDQ